MSLTNQTENVLVHPEHFSAMIALTLLDKRIPFVLGDNTECYRIRIDSQEWELLSNRREWNIPVQTIADDSAFWAKTTYGNIS